MLTSELDDSQIALRIATAAAMYAAAFFVGISILTTFLEPGFFSSFFEVTARVIATIIALAMAHSRIEEARTLTNPDSIPFLSTIFFYGITLLLVYLGQIGYVLFHLFLSQNASFFQEIKFLLGVSSFSGSAFVIAFI